MIVFFMDGCDFVGWFAISCAISCHLISKKHHGVTRSWFANKWFWLGLLGNLPVLIGLLGHIYLLRTKSG